MAISTATTTLKYGIKQVESTLVVGTIGTSGNATFTVTGAGISGSPVAVSVAVLSGDTATIVANKAVTAVNNNSAINALYVASSSGATFILTALAPATDDATLNIAYTNDTCTGLTPDATSVDTTAGTAFAKLVDITNYPDMGSTPSKLDTTDLSQSALKTSILGLQELPDLTFECNYDEAVYSTISAMTSNYTFGLYFGTTDGVFTWDGQIRIYVTGAGVDEVRKMTVVLSASSAIDFSTN